MRIILVNFHFHFFFCFQYFKFVLLTYQHHIQISIVRDFNATSLRYSIFASPSRESEDEKTNFSFTVLQLRCGKNDHAMSSFIRSPRFFSERRRKFPPLDGTLLPLNPRVTRCTPPIPFSPWPPCRIDAPSFRGAGGAFFAQS